MVIILGFAGCSISEEFLQRKTTQLCPCAPKVAIDRVYVKTCRDPEVHAVFVSHTSVKLGVGRGGRLWKAAQKASARSPESPPWHACALFPGRLHGGLGQAPPHSDQGLQSQHRHQLWGVYSQSGWSVRWPQNWNPERHSPEGKRWPCRCWARKNSSQVRTEMPQGSLGPQSHHE